MSEKYNYLEHETQDVLDWIDDSGGLTSYMSSRGCDDLEDVRERLNDDLWCDDGVTGNGSGSYTFNANKAAHHVADNLDLLADVVDEFGCDAAKMIRDPEGADVSIRCWLLSQAIDKAIEKLCPTLVEVC